MIINQLKYVALQTILFMFWQGSNLYYNLTTWPIGTEKELQGPEIY